MQTDLFYIETWCCPIVAVLFLGCMIMCVPSTVDWRAVTNFISGMAGRGLSALCKWTWLCCVCWHCPFCYFRIWESLVKSKFLRLAILSLTIHSPYIALCTTWVCALLVGRLFDFSMIALCSLSLCYLTSLWGKRKKASWCGLWLIMEDIVLFCFLFF